MEAPIIVHIEALTPRALELLTELSDELGPGLIRIVRNGNVMPGFTRLEDTWLTRENLLEMADAIGEERHVVRHAAHVVHCEIFYSPQYYLGRCPNKMPRLSSQVYDMYATRADEFLLALSRDNDFLRLTAAANGPDRTYVAAHYDHDVLIRIWGKLATFLASLAPREAITV